MANESFGIGCDTSARVSELYESPFAFTGEIMRVMVDTSEPTFKQFAARHEARARARFAMAMQCNEGGLRL